MITMFRATALRGPPVSQDASGNCLDESGAVVPCASSEDLTPVSQTETGACLDASGTVVPCGDFGKAASLAAMAQSIDSTMAAVIAARNGAAGVVASPPFLTDGSVLAAWRGSVAMLDGRIIPLLQSTIAQAKSDPFYADKWLNTARAAESQANQVLKDRDQNGLINALEFTITQTAATIKAAAVKVYNTVQRVVHTVASNPWTSVLIAAGVIGGALYVRHRVRA